MTPIQICRGWGTTRLAAVWLALLTLLIGPSLASAQSSPKTAAKQPATPDEAARVLDLRTFPLMEGATVSSDRTLGLLMYEAKGTSKAVVEFQRQQLVKRGFKELPGAYSDATSGATHFTKDGFLVSVSASDMSGDPAKAGWSRVALVNDGNVDLKTLPVPAGVTPFHPDSYRAAYTTKTGVAETAAACEKLLLAAGWEPYGGPGLNEKADSSMQDFKRNAIRVQAWVSLIPAEGNKTLIRYDTELLSADLPAPPGTARPDYTDFQKTLRFDSPTEQTDAIIAFYQERLPKLGWKATSERPIADARNKTQFLVYRNPQKEMLSLDLAQFTGVVRVELRHQTEAEVAEEERLAAERAELEKQRLAKQNMKIKVSVPLPAAAGNVEHERPNLIEFTLATGSGPAALGSLREHFAKEGWTEQEGTKMDKNTGSASFKKDSARLSCSYFDTGLLDADIRISAYQNVELEPVTAKGKPAEAPKDGPPAVKKPAKPAVPGLPGLPPGVELPDDVKSLIEKALKDAAP